MNPRPFVITGIILTSIILVGIATYQTVIATATLNLSVSPTDANIKVDGSTRKPGQVRLIQGSHTITASRDGFKTATVKIRLTANQQLNENIALQPANDQAYANWQIEHPDQAAQAEGVAGAKVNQEGDIITQNNPLIQHLPYEGADFQITFGRSQKHPDNREAVGIYITASTDTAKTHALNWIKAQGYDPSSYELIYE